MARALVISGGGGATYHGAIITHVRESMSRMIPAVGRENSADFVSRVWDRGNLQHLQATQIHIAIDDLLADDHDSIDVDPFVQIPCQLLRNLPCTVKNQSDRVPFNTDP